MKNNSKEENQRENQGEKRRKNEEESQNQEENLKENQKEVWNKIASEWDKFRNNPEKRIIDFLKDSEGNIADFGSGSGRYLIKDLNKQKKLYLIDFSEKMIDLAKKKAKKRDIESKFYVNDLEKTSFTDNFFDAGIFVSVLHSIPKKEKRENVVKEIFRVMKPNREVMVSVWNKNSSWFKNKPKEIYMGWRNKGKRYHYLYDEEEIHRLFKEVGFKIKERFIPERNIVFIVKKPSKLMNKNIIE